MRLLMPALLAITLVPGLASAESLGGIWYVTAVECHGKPVDLFTVSESVNGGEVTAVYELESLEFSSRSVTFVSGRHLFKLSTGLRVPGKKGSFKMKLLGERRVVRWIIDGEVLTLSIPGLAVEPVVVKATRKQVVRAGITTTTTQ